jgi:hypothetical protein
VLDDDTFRGAGRTRRENDPAVVRHPGGPGYASGGPASRDGEALFDDRTDLGFLPDELSAGFGVGEVHRDVRRPGEQDTEHGYVQLRRPARRADADTVAATDA